MSQAVSDDAPVVDGKGAARSALYSLFAKALSHPSEAILADFLSGQFDADIKGLMKEAGYTAISRAPAPITLPAHDLKVAYATAFEAGLPKVSLREANYIREGEKVLFEDLFRFYDHFGLDTSSGALREWPDHIAVELEFMHYLVWLEAGPDTNLGPLRRAQKDFLTLRLGAWAQDLAGRLEDKGIPAPWPHVVRHLVRLISEDLSMLK